MKTPKQIIESTSWKDILRKNMGGIKIDKLPSKTEQVSNRMFSIRTFNDVDIKRPVIPGLPVVPPANAAPAAKAAETPVKPV